MRYLCLVLVAFVVGCGGDDGAEPAEFSDYTEAEVARLAGFESERQFGTVSYTHLGCHVSVVLTTPAEVELYRDPGPVVTNPSGTVGVKFGSDAPDVSQADCAAILETALERVP